MQIHPNFIKGRSFMQNFYSLLDNGSDDELMKRKLELKSRKLLLDDPEVRAKCDSLIRKIDEELLYRQELALNDSALRLERE